MKQRFNTQITHRPDGLGCWLKWACVVAAGVISACSVAPKAPVTPEKPVTPDKAVITAPLPSPAAASPERPAAVVAAPQPKAEARASAATTPRAYRSSGAKHIYELNADRVFRGRLPPLLYAVGVLNVEIDREGRVSRLDWLRAPRHAPEVVREIERTVRAAAPFPAPVRLGKVVYTDTWLWHASGKFQLDTLTEGQD
jgi:hypothetical protein